MAIKQLTVFLDNQRGRLVEVTGILKEKNINLEGFSATEARDYGILRLIVSDIENADKALKEAGFTTHLADVICMEVENRPGEFYKTLDILAREGINIDYIYVIADSRMVMSVSDVVHTEEILRRNDIKLC